LSVEAVKKSNLISVSYESQNPQLAAKVLDTLNAAYIQKHLEVHPWCTFKERITVSSKKLDT
jgi:uncharacterized protein involved in exopolysaccharide biosynthesis